MTAMRPRSPEGRGRYRLSEGDDVTLCLPRRTTCHRVRHPHSGICPFAASGQRRRPDATPEQLSVGAVLCVRSERVEQYRRARGRLGTLVNASSKQWRRHRTRAPNDGLDVRFGRTEQHVGAGRRRIRSPATPVAGSSQRRMRPSRQASAQGPRDLPSAHHPGGHVSVAMSATRPCIPKVVMPARSIHPVAPK